MSEHPRAKVLVNESPIELNEFVESYFAFVSIGIVKTLKGVDFVKKVEFHQEKGDVTVKVNGNEISITQFPNDIINSTLMGILAPLKGFDKVEQLDVIVDA